MKINLKKIVLNYKPLLLFTGIMIFIQLIINTIFPYLTKFIIDDVLIKQQLNNFGKLLLFALVLVILLIPINILVSYLCSKLVQVVVFDLRKIISDFFIEQKENDKNNGLFINKIISDCDIIGNQLLLIMINSVPNIILMVLYIFILVNLSVKLTIITLITVPLFAFSAYITSKKIFTLTKLLQNSKDKLIGFLNTYVRNKLMINLYGIKKEEQNNFLLNISDLKEVSIRTSTLTSFFNNINGLLSVIAPLMTLFWGSLMVINKELSLGSMIVFNSYTSLIFLPVSKLLNLPSLISQIRVSLGRIEHFEEQDEEAIEGGYVTTDLLPSYSQLEVENVIPYIYDNPLFSKEISLNLKKGDIWRVEGNNGIGKSIFLKTLVNYHTNYKGLIKKDRNIKINFVPQENFLFDGNVKDNMTKGIKYYNEKKLFSLIKLLKFDVPLDTNVDAFRMSLSSGQLQKIKIIRALLSKPDVLILDEVLSNLEIEVINNVLTEIKEGKITLFIIYHGNMSDILSSMTVNTLNLNDYL